MHAIQRTRILFVSLVLMLPALAPAQAPPAAPQPAAPTVPPQDKATEESATQTPAPVSAVTPDATAKETLKDPAAEPKLRFNFRFQRWSDVLEWFAEQAGLSLVLDAPPPGTFNYSDDREYTVAESLDLLNGVLLTKGHTLIRRERMLILVDLSQGIPETLVPRVKLEELDKRGRFEIVSVLFPVGKRAAADVVTEIAPLLSPRGKSQALPQTGQVLVTDTAGVMRAINAVIESIPEPRRPEGAAPEKPQLSVYPLKSADADAAVKVLEALMPDAKFVRDPGANQLSAYATPTQQEAVKNVIEQLQSTEGPAESRARFEVYQLDSADMPGALATLQPLVPTARLTVDALSKKLAAWGTPADHAILAKAVGQLVSGVDGTDDRQVEVYRLGKANPTSVAAMLPTVAPRARVAVDLPTKSLVVLASLADHQAIKATIDQIETQKPTVGAPEIRLYPVGPTAPATLVAVLQPLVPQATLSIDAAQRRIAVTATPADHAVVKQAIDEYLKATPSEEQRKLILYPVTPAERTRFQTLLTTLTADFPNVKVVLDAEPGELAVWATPGEHEVIAGIVEQLKQATPAEDAYQLVAYPIRTADPSSVLTVLQNLFPGTKVVLDLKTRRLVAWTRPSQQQAIKALVEQIDSDEGGELKSQLMTYPVDGFDPSAAITTLRTLVPDVTLSYDTTAKTIVAFGRKSDHDKIAESLKQLRPSDDPALRPHVVSYPVGASDPNVLYPLITYLVPTARVVPNAANGTIAVWAAPSDHTTIKAAIDEMTASSTDATGPRLVVYTLKETTATGITSAIQAAVPLARFGVSQNPRKLVVWAKPSEHETIRGALAELDKEELDGHGNVLKAYQIRTAEPTTLLSNLQVLFATRPTVRLSLDLKNRKIVAMAAPGEHETIQRVIDEVESGSPIDADAKFEVHQLAGADPTVVMQVLTNLLKDTRAVLSTDARGEHLVAVATPEQHQTIKDAIARLQTAVRELEVFQLDVVEAAAAELAIQRLFAAGTRGRGRDVPLVEADNNTARLYVRANQQDLAEIRDLLVKMGETRLAGGGTGSNVRTIPFSGDTRAALAEIERIWPQLSKSPLRVLRTPSSFRDSLTRPPADLPAPPAGEEPPAAPPIPTDPKGSTTAVPPEVKTAAQEGAEPAPQAPASQAPAPQTPPVATEPAPPATTPPPAPEKQPAAPAEIIVSPGDDKITIMSDDPETIEQFERLLRSLSPAAGPGGRSVSIYPLKSADSVTVAQLLKSVFRRGAFDFGDSMAPTIEADERLNAIVVYAGRNDRAMIEQLLEVLDTDQVPETLATNRPMRIHVKHTDAGGIENVLRDLYQTQLSSGARGKPIPIPSGASRDVAAVIQQLNIAAAGPLMTLGVDDATNSVVVMAPRPLAEEVSQLVGELDEAALKDNSRSVQVVKLKATSADQVKQVLDRLIRDATQRQSSGGRRGRR
jgi:type II secretory pathway component GspD/PulD (secretin)